MADIATAVATAPRPRPTLRDSLLSYRSAGFNGQVTVLADGAPTEPLADLNVGLMVNDPPRGALKNFAFGLEWMLAHHTAPWLLMMQDDITWAEDAARALDADLADIKPKRIERAGCLSLYCARKISMPLERRFGKPLPAGWHNPKLGWQTWGAQAYLFTRHGAEMLVADPQFQNFVANYVKNRNIDRIVAKCLHEMGLAILYRIPCMVDHSLGSANSSLAPKPVQRMLQTDYWTGQP